jgi:hypothetical protein
MLPAGKRWSTCSSRWHMSPIEGYVAPDTDGEDVIRIEARLGPDTYGIDLKRQMTRLDAVGEIAAETVLDGRETSERGSTATFLTTISRHPRHSLSVYPATLAEKHQRYGATGERVG